jgi:hypothetical protein
MMEKEGGDASTTGPRRRLQLSENPIKALVKMVMDQYPEEP